jgi:hypothetical protein
MIDRTHLPHPFSLGLGLISRLAAILWRWKPLAAKEFCDHTQGRRVVKIFIYPIILFNIACTVRAAFDRGDSNAQRADRGPTRNGRDAPRSDSRRGVFAAEC